MEPPSAPDFAVPWDDLDRTFDWIRRMRGVPQDPVHHAEGDVWIHTRMVCEAMAKHPIWRALPADERRITWLSALFHDVAKPDCTRTEIDGKIHSRGHSHRGAIQTRRILWEMGLPFTLREQVAPLVLHHQVPFHLLDRDDPARLAYGISVAARCDHLALLAECDARGRRCDDQGKILDNVDLFRAFCEEEECLTAPWAFPSDHTRFGYFQRGASSPRYVAHEDFRCEVVIMSGLPGAGKTTWAQRHLPGWPVVSLDDLREELDVDPEGAQGEVVQAARERARAHLRAGRGFVWSATNLSRRKRAQIVRLCADYGARIRIVYVEAEHDALFRQNAGRAHAVPERVIHRFLESWEVPDRTEAHVVDYVV